MRLEEHLRHHATHSRDKTAVICGGETCTYGQLFDRTRRRAADFRKGEAVVFRTTQDIDFLVTYFAAHIADAVAVPLGADVSDGELNRVAEELKGCALPPDTADVLFTTGTTGDAKGVAIGYGAIVANAENLIDAQHYTEDLTFIICGPLNHIGSLSKVWPIILLGGTLYILDGMKDMNAFYSALDRSCPKLASFLVPTSIRMLLRFGAGRLAEYADKIDFIETGAAPLARTDILELCRQLPKSRLYNTYASTETGIISTYNFNDGLCMEGCVGKVMKHSSVSVDGDGTIVCGGATLMSGYVAGDCGLMDGKVVTRDLGAFDENGMLHLLGRNDDIINIGGFKVAPTEVENAALAMDGIVDCICTAVDHPISGKALKLLFVPSEGVTVRNTDIAEFLKSRLETFKVPSLYECVSEISRTFNGKLDRKAYR